MLLLVSRQALSAPLPGCTGLLPRGDLPRPSGATPWGAAQPRVVPFPECLFSTGASPLFPGICCLAPEVANNSTSAAGE